MATAELLTDEMESTRPQSAGVIASAQASRQMAEVQSAMVIAKRFPRDETAAISRIVNSCKRIGLAEAAMYSYPRGGQQVTGPSIRLAEAMAQAWGNLDFGIVELEQRQGESVVMSYCVDLETNTRQTKVFTVKHERDKKTGNVKLTDSRDIYEMTANQGARRLRACILGVIPGDVQDTAIAQCEATIKKGSGEPLIDRVRKMVIAFSDYSVTQAMLEKRIGHKIDATNEAEFVSLRKIYTSIRDGASSREQWFEFEGSKQVRESDLNKPTVKPTSEVEQLKQPEGEAVNTTPSENAKSMIDEFTTGLPAKTEVNAVKEHCTEFRAAIASSDWPEDLKAATDDQLCQLADERIAAIRSTRGK